MKDTFVTEATYLQLYDAYQKLREKTINDCRVIAVIRVRKDLPAEVLPISRISHNIDGGVKVYIEE